MFYSCYHQVVDLTYLLQFPVKPEASETFLRYYRVFVQIRQYEAVACVAKVIDEGFQFFIDGIQLWVGTVSHCGGNGAQEVFQLVLPGISSHIVRKACQASHVSKVVGVVYYDLLRCYVSLHSQTQNSYEEEPVGIHVEHCGVLVRLICHPCSKRYQHCRCQTFSEGYRPRCLAGHAETGVVQYVEEYEDYHRYDDGHS